MASQCTTCCEAPCICGVCSRDECVTARDERDAALKEAEGLRELSNGRRWVMDNGSLFGESFAFWRAVQAAMQEHGIPSVGHLRRVLDAQRRPPLEAENERLRERLRATAQTLVAAVGFDGPADADAVAARAVNVIENYRDENVVLRAESDEARKEVARLRALVLRDDAEAKRAAAVTAVHAELEHVRRERNAVATARSNEHWIWSDTDENYLDSLVDDATVAMRAGQLRALLERAQQRWWVMAGLDEETMETVLRSFSVEEREAIQLMRQQLTEQGVTKEPLRTRMACEFAEVLLALKKKGRND